MIVESLSCNLAIIANEFLASLGWSFRLWWPYGSLIRNPGGFGISEKRLCRSVNSLYSKRNHMQIKKVGVLGCGLMGSGIAQVSAVAGYDVTVLEQEQKFLDKGFADIEKSLAKFAEKPEKTGITPEKAKEARARIKGTTSQKDLADCDIIVEAIIENVDVKKKTFAELDTIVKKEAIFASNTSSISITEVAAATKRADRFVGLHFFNPVPLMKLVEVARTIATDNAAFETAY